MLNRHLYFFSVQSLHTIFFFIFITAVFSSAGFSNVHAQVNSSQSKADKGSYKTAIFAGGCFWCMEADFDDVNGVLETLSGYSDGHVKNPTYKQVSTGGSGHVEVVKIIFDPAIVRYDELLSIFWRNIDPTVADRQFCDRGRQYRAAIFYLDDEQKEQALQSRRVLEKTKSFKEPIVTEIIAATQFYVAESYHQNYHNKNPLRYKYYRYSCGRDKRLQQLWGDAG